MEKYKVTSKGKKTLFCTYYKATNTNMNTNHTIQKLSRRENWEQILANKDILLMKQNQLQCLPSIFEAVHEEGKFFIVMGDDLGINVDDLRKQKLDLYQIAMIGLQILEATEKLTKEGVEFFDIRPQFLFWNKPHIKIVYTPNKEQSFLKNLNGQFADIRHYSPQTILEGQLDIASAVFSTGLIMAEMILGQSIIPVKNKLDYIYCLAQLFPKDSSNTVLTLEKRLSKMCSKELTAIIIQMMNPDREKRIKLNQAVEKLKVVDPVLSQNVSVEPVSKEDSQSQQYSKIIKSSQSNILQSTVKQPIVEKEEQNLITFNFQSPPQNPPLIELVQQLKIVTILKKQSNTADDVTIATLVTGQTKSQQLNDFQDFDIPQQAVIPQLTVFAKQDNQEDIFHVPGLSDQDDNGLFQLI